MRPWTRVFLCIVIAMGLPASGHAADVGQIEVANVKGVEGSLTCAGISVEEVSAAQMLAPVPLVGITASALKARDDVPDRVTFPGPGQISLVGYLFLPNVQTRRVPAIVMMHGRAGPYSTAAKGVYDATTLSKRHMMWGRLWAEEGYVVLLVDSFSPRGYPGGFPAHSYVDRPDEVNEVTVRPLDAYAALTFLRARPEVDPSRVAVQGWSNGGSATLATMSDGTLTAVGLKPEDGFRGGIAFYPACGLHDRFVDGYRPYAPVRVFSGDDDEEVSAKRCARLVERSKNLGGDIEIFVYEGATHDFDDPGKRRQSVEANVIAADDATRRVRAFMHHLLDER